jgi:hypothetical protein
MHKVFIKGGWGECKTVIYSGGHLQPHNRKSAKYFACSRCTTSTEHTLAPHIQSVERRKPDDFVCHYMHATTRMPQQHVG